MAQKRAFNEGKRHFKKNKKQKTSTVSDGSNEEVLLADIRRLLKSTNIDEAEKSEPKEQTEIDVEIAEISSTGDGLAQVQATAKAHGRTLVVLADNPATLPPPAPTRASPLSTLVIESWNTVLQRAAYASGRPVRSMYLFTVGADGSLAPRLPAHFLTNYQV